MSQIWDEYVSGYAERRKQKRQEAEKTRARLNVSQMYKDYSSLLSHEKNLLTDYNNRFFDKNGNYVDKYYSDFKDFSKNYNERAKSAQNKIESIKARLDTYKNIIPDDTAKEMLNNIKNISDSIASTLEGVKASTDYLGQFENETMFNYRNHSATEMYDAYTGLLEQNPSNKNLDYIGAMADAKMGWLNTDMESDADMVTARRRKYARNQALIKYYNDKIDNIITWDRPSPSDDEKKKLIAARDKLIRENNLYEQNQKDLDAHYDVQLLEDFDKVSANRAYDAPTTEEMYSYLDEINAQSAPDSTGVINYGNDKYSFDDPLGVYLASDNGARTIGGLSYTDKYANETTKEYDRIISEGTEGYWEQLKPEEINTYYYYLNTEGKDKALSFLDDMKNVLSKRRSTKKTEDIADAEGLEAFMNNVLSVPANVMGGAMGLVGDALNYLGGNEYDPYAPWHDVQNFGSTVREETAKDLNAATGNGSFLGLKLGDVYGAGMSGIDSMAASVFGKGAPVLLGLSAASSEMKRLYDEGATGEQIFWGGSLAGAAEMVFEKLSIDKFVDNFFKSGRKGSNSLILKILAQGGVEASEETATTIANTLTDIAVRGNTSDLMTKIDIYMADGLSRGEATVKALGELGVDIWKSAAGGFISGSGMGATGASIGAGTSAITSAIEKNKQIKQTGIDIRSAGNIDKLVNAALETENTEAHDLAVEIKDIVADGVENLDSKTIAKLDKMVGRLSSLTAKTTAKSISNTPAEIISAIAEQKLKDHGYADKDIPGATKSIVKSILNKDQTLTRREREAMSPQDRVEIINEILKNKDVAGEISKTQQERFNKLLTQATLSKTNEKTAGISTKDYSVSDDGKTYYNGTEVKITGIASVKGGAVSVNISNGDTVNVKDLDMPAESAILYEGVSQLDVTPAIAKTIVNSYTGGISPAEYIYGVRDAIRYGKIGAKAYLDQGTFTKGLTKIQREEFYKIGAASEDVKTKSAPKKAITTRGKITFKGVDRSKLNYRQKASVDALEVISRVMGVNVTVFNSPTNDKGVHIGENGSYNTKTNTIEVDISAGINGNGLMLFTAAHELTHYIKEWSPEKFKVFSDFLVEKYAEHGVDLDALIQNKMDTFGYDYDLAFEEVVADSCESFLRDSNLLQTLTELARKDMTLYEKIRAFISDLLDRVKRAFANVTPDSIEGREVLKMKDALEDLHRLWEEAALDAMQNSADDSGAQIGSKNLNDFSEAKTTDGERLFQYRAMEEDIPAYRNLLEKHSDLSNDQISGLFKTVDKAIELIKDNLEILDYAWDEDINDRAFDPVKPNSDSLYKFSVDFSTMCRKRILQQVIIEELQTSLQRAVTKAESIAIRNELMKIQEEGRQIEIACALCYVESARMKSPAQIQRFLNDRGDIVRKYFAAKSKGDIKEQVAKAEADTRKRLAKQYAEEIEKGDVPDPTLMVGKKTKKFVSLKSLPQKIADEIRDAKRAVIDGYKPNANEDKIIKTAENLSVEDFTTAAGLENLAKYHAEIFDAYTSYIRNATKSKGTEKDVWWRIGDTKKLTDDLIATMNAENGLRTQSWSDFQVMHMLDYIGAIIELSARKAKMQAYTKVPDYVHLMGNTNQMINLSLIPAAEFNGKLDFDSVEGMAFKTALELRDEYPDVAGTISIGINNEQIEMLLESALIDYVIPYHQSGMSKVVRKEMHIPTWESYESFQGEKTLKGDEAKSNAKRLGTSLLSSKDENWHKKPKFSEWFDVDEARQIAEMENHTPTNPELQKKYGVMYGGYMAMQNAANNYLKLCGERGLTPKFSHAKANFTTNANYWKLLIDRKMINNVTGEIIEQKSVQAVFDEAEVLRILNDEVARYGTIKADQDYATRTVVQKFLSGKMTEDTSKIAARILEKPVDNIAVASVLNSADEDKHLVKKGSAYHEENRKKQSKRDSNGKELSPGQQEYFKDSKVRDKNGDLLVVYHSTGADFTVFDIKRSGQNYEGNSQYGRGMYFAGGKNGAIEWGGYSKVVEAYLDIQNPFYVTEQTPEELLDEFPEAKNNKWAAKRGEYFLGFLNGKGIDTTEWLQSHGYDGIIDEEATVNYGGLSAQDKHQYVVFDSSQIKLTTNLNPTKDKDIRFQKRQDADYLDAINRGDMDTVQRMVDEAAKEAGYPVKAYHGTPDFGFTKFDPSMSDDNTSLFFTESIDVAKTYAGRDVYGTKPVSEAKSFSYTKGKRYTEDELKEAHDFIQSKYHVYGTTKINVEKQTVTHAGTRYSAKQIMEMADSIAKRGIYGVYINTDGTLKVDAKNRNWAGMDIPEDYYEFAKDTFWGGNSSVLSTRDYAKYAKAKGYKGVTITNLRDYGNANPPVAHRLEREGKSWATIHILFDSNQVKSADPVTYDDNDNIIPLSKRFDKSDDDIRRSERDPNQIKYLEQVNKTLTKENARLTEEVKALKDLVSIQKTVTNGTKFTKTSVQAAARNLIKTANAKGNVAELVPLLNNFYEYLRGGDVSWDGIINNAFAAADWLVTNSQTDTLFARQDLVWDIYDSYWKLSTLVTYADRKQAQINKLKAKHKDRVDTLRAEYREKIAEIKAERSDTIKAVRSKMRAEAQEKIKEVTEKYREARSKNVEGRKKTEIRNKIKGVANDLLKLYKAGRKKSNVKADMRDTVEKALYLADVLFTAPTNEELIRNGIASLTSDEIKKLKMASGLIDKRDQIKDAIVLAEKSSSPNLSALEKQLKSVSAKLSKLTGELKDVFERERYRLSNTKVSDAIESLAEAYKAIGQNPENYIRGAYNEYVYGWLTALKTDVGGTLAQDMTMSQLESVYNAYKMVLHSVRKANKLFQSEKDVSVTVDDVIREVRTYFKGKERAAIGSKFNEMIWNELKPRVAFERIGSDTLLELYDSLRKGEDTFARDVEEAHNFVDEARKRHGFDKWDINKRTPFELESGKTFNLNLEQMMSIYAYSKRDQALKHMEEGGFVFDSKETFKKDKGIFKLIPNPDTYRLSAQDLYNIVSYLENNHPQAKAYVDDMQKYLTDMGDKGNEVSRLVFGIDLFKEKVYFPLKSSEDYTRDNTDALDPNKQPSQLINSGFTKETTPEASNPIVLSSFDSVWENHVKKMSLYHSFVPALEDFNKVYRYSRSIGGKDDESVKAEIRKVYGDNAINYITKFIQDINGGVAATDASSVTESLFGKFKKTAVGASLSTAIQQPFSILRAMSVIDPKYFVGKSKKTTEATKWAEIKKYAPVAVLKEIGGFDAGAGRGIREYLTGDFDKTKLQKAGKAIDEAAMFISTKADEIGWGIIWDAVQREISDTTSLESGTEEYYEACGKRFTEVVTQTQVYDSTFSRSGYMRSDKWLHRAATTFMSEPTTVINMIYSVALKGARGKASKALIARTVSSVIASQLMASIAKSLIYAIRDDDDDENFAEKYVESLGSSLRDDINIMNYLPYLREFASLVEGWSVDRPDLSVVSDVVDSTKDLFDENKDFEQKWVKFAGTVLNLFGIPAKNAYRDIKGIWDTAIASFNGKEASSDDLVEAFWDGLANKDTSLKQRAWNAFKSGNNTRVTDTVNGMVKDKADSLDKNEYKTAKDRNKEAKSRVRSSFTTTYKKEYLKCVEENDKNGMNEIRKFLYRTGLYGSLKELDETLKKWRDG